MAKLIDEMGLGAEVLAMKKENFSLKQIRNRLQQEHGLRLSEMSISNWLRSESARNTCPAKSSRVLIREFLLRFGKIYNDNRRELCDDCRPLLDKMKDKLMEELQETLNE